MSHGSTPDIQTHDTKLAASRHAEIGRRALHGRTTIGQAVVSPDGQHVAAVSATINLDDNKTTTRIIVDGEIVTAGPNDANPQWSPDGRWLLFTSRRSEKKSEATLHAMPVGGPGETRTICTMADGLASPRWSPDGRTVAFLSRTRDSRYDAPDESWQSPRKIERLFTRLNGEGWTFDRPQHVYVVAADGATPAKNLTPGPFEFGDVAWTPDGLHIVTTSGRHERWDRDLVIDLWSLDLDGSLRAITSRTGLYHSPSVSPDGTTVAFVGFDDTSVLPQNDRVAVVPFGGGPHRYLAPNLDRPFGPPMSPVAPIWVDDQTLLSAAEDRGAVRLVDVPVDGSDASWRDDNAASVTSFSYESGTLAVTRSTVDQPSDLWVERNGEVDRVATGAATWEGIRHGWEKFSVLCTDGSGEIDAWVMLPPGGPAVAPASLPVLLNVHGGPFAQYGETYFDEAQMQAEAGFMVVMGNPRGSSGREEAWGQAINGPRHAKAPGTGWGSVDVDDVMAVLEAAIDRYPAADPQRVGMLGGSYGGYMATTLAVRFGDRFRAICSERAVNDLAMEEWSSDIGGYFQAEHGVSVVEDPAEYARMSPSQQAHKIEVPMLIIHSEDDLRCPIDQADQLFMILTLLDRDVTYYRFPAENHELSRSGSPVHRQQRAEIILDFFRDHLRAPHESA